MGRPPPRRSPWYRSAWNSLRIRVTSLFRRRREDIPVAPSRQHPPVDREMAVFNRTAAMAMQRVVGGTLTTSQAAAAFYACHPPAFDGQVHPTRVKDWFHQISSILRICDISEDAWVSLAASRLIGNARIFWEAFTPEEISAMTWNGFRERLFYQFVMQALPRETRPPPGMIPVSFDSAREFVLLAESVQMGEGESMESYLARMLSDVFAYNTVFDLTDDQRNQMLWRGMTEDYQRQLIPLPGRPFFSYLRKVRLCGDARQRQIGPRMSVRRTFPQPMRHDAEASTSRQPEAEPSTSRRRPRETDEIEEEDQSPLSRRRTTLEPIQEDSDEEEEDPEEDPAEDP